MKLGMDAKRNAAFYKNANPRQLGNLHERMKFVMKALEKARGFETNEPDHGKFDQMYPDLVCGLFDLQNEVRYYTPARPAFGKRIVTLGGR